MVWRQEKVLRTNLQPNPSFRATSGTYTNVRTNLVPGGFNVDSNADGVADGWVAYNSSATGITYTATGGTQRIQVSSLAASGGSRAGIRVSPEITSWFKTGYPVQVSVDAKGTLAAGQTIRVYIDWVKSDNTTLAGVTSIAVTSTLTTSMKTYSADSTSSTGGEPNVPDDAVLGRGYIWVEGGTSAGAVDVTLDNLIVETSSYRGRFFDGASANGTFDSNLESVWVGTANASASVARGKAVYDWTNTPANSVLWQAEDGQSAYLRNTGLIPWASGVAPLYTQTGIPVSVGSSISGSIQVFGETSAVVTLQGYATSGTGTISSRYSDPASGGYVASVGGYVIEPGTVFVRLIVRFIGNYAPGTQVRVSRALVEVSPTANVYFDGDNINNPNVAYRWNGVANRSSSDMYIPTLATPPSGLWDSSTSGYAESWYVDGVDVQSMAFGIETVDSQPPSLKGDHLALSGANGVIPQFNRAYEPGSIALKMWVLGCEVDGTVPGLRSGRRQLFERNLRMLLRLFGYQGNIITLKKTIYGDSLDSAPITVTARAIVSEVSSIDTQMARQRATVSVALTLVDSFWSDATVTTDTTGASATVPKTLNLTDVGTAPVDDAVIKITGPIASPRVTCPASGSWIQYNGTLPAGQTLTIDSKAGTAFLGTNSVLTNVTHGGTAKFMVIPPRNQGTVTDTGFQTALTLSGSSAGTATSMSVSYYRKHWVIV